MSIVGRLTVGAIMVAAGGDESEATIAAVTGGLIIGASAIPVFYRDRIERLKAGRTPVRVLDDRVDDRMAEMEHLHQEQIAELEERIDFAERLLTKQRDEIGRG
jgi:phosphoglycerate-specific signal transduction histidine kinase